ncbi:conserved membrane protein of unknown function [Rhodovastum atsumiense]|nr:MFS transporter [Rhodovastum atsumiense]CAH2604892.1 conserved membrane protein of unknown function [Rhodovastum atsumiense]
MSVALSRSVPTVVEVEPEVMTSLAGLNWLNFLVALMQTGFGAFLAVHLTTQGWSASEIGFVLSAGTVAAVASQVPAGLLVDWVPNKRAVVAAALLTLMSASLLIATMKLRLPVYAALILQGMAGSVLAPAIAAITLALARQEHLGERLGHNVRFAAMGSTVAAGIMGAVALWFSHQAIFLLAASCAPAALLTLQFIRPGAMAAARSRTSHRGALGGLGRGDAPTPARRVLRDRRLLIFAACVALFQVGNAALLPLAASAITRATTQAPELALATGGSGRVALLHDRLIDLVVPASIILPQILAALISPQLGRLAHHWARRPVLLIGFIVLPLRAALFACDGSPQMMVAYQALDGISAAVFGVMLPLVVADITHDHGRFNLGMGVVGLAVGLGAAVSTGTAGTLADASGAATAFLGLAAAGVAACVVVWLVMPETRLAPRSGAPEPDAPAPCLSPADG